jgi:hypothetical protein
MMSSGSSAGRGGDRFAPILAWTLLALTLVAAIVGLLLELATESLDAGFAEEIGLMAAFLAFPVVGALIAARHPRNAVGWMFLAIGLLVAVLILSTSYARYALVLHPEEYLPGATLAAWIENWAWLPLISTIPTLLLLLFPTGRPPSSRWTPLVWVSGAYISVITMLSMLEEELSGYGLRNPIGIRGLGDVEEMGPILLPVFPLILLCASSLIFRYRKASSEERQQLKWVAVAALFLAAGWIAGEWLPTIMFPIFLGALPGSIGVAMLKCRLYDIDVIINRTLVYGALTAILGLVYLSLVFLLQLVTSALMPESDIAVAGSTLAVAAMFRPARSRVQAFIDRRFYRRKYDAVRTLEDFTRRLRHGLDLDAVADELVAVANDALQPSKVSLWLRPTGLLSEKEA